MQNDLAVCQTGIACVALKVLTGGSTSIVIQNLEGTVVDCSVTIDSKIQVTSFNLVLNYSNPFLN